MNVSTYNSRAGYSDVVPVGLKLRRGRNTIGVSCAGYSSTSEIKSTAKASSTEFVIADFTMSLEGFEVHEQY